MSPRIRLETLRQSDSVSPIEVTQDQRPAQQGFRQDIEGLRAVAVLGVVLFHAAGLLATSSNAANADA